MRINDQLWADFVAIVSKRGFTGSEALKRLVEGFVSINRVKRKKRSAPVQDDESIVVDIGTKGE